MSSKSGWSLSSRVRDEDRGRGVCGACAPFAFAWGALAAAPFTAVAAFDAFAPVAARAAMDLAGAGAASEASDESWRRAVRAGAEDEVVTFGFLFKSEPDTA
jgi:hypothetical protein